MTRQSIDGETEHCHGRYGSVSVAEQSANTYFLRIESINLSKWYSARFSIGRKVHKIVEVAESDACIFAIFALELDRR